MDLRSAWMRAVAVAAAVVLLDQLAKVLALQTSASVVVPARNSGLLTGWSPVSGAVVTVLSVAVLALFLGCIGRWVVQIGISPTIPALIAGGMFAHTLDRVRFGGVRDFLAVGWLIIDVADMAVVAGLVALVVAVALRAHRLHTESRTIGFEFPGLRAVVRDA